MEELTVKNYFFGDFELDTAKRRLLKQGEFVALNSKAFDLLLVLVQSYGQVLSKEELLEKVWPGQFVEENNLTVHISALRKIFGEKKGEHNFIVTLPGKGYSFVASISVPETDIVIENYSVSRVTIEGIEPENLKTKPVALPEGTRKISRLFKYVLPVSGLILLALVFGAGAYFWQGGKHSEPFKDVSVNRLTSSGKVSNAALSPDGKLFAYSTIGTPIKSLRLGHTAGGEELELRPPADVTYRSLHFSPDSNQLYYVMTGKSIPKGALFRMPVFGGVPEKLRDNLRAQIAFSPDMDRYAYVHTDGENDISKLVIASIVGDEEIGLTVRPEQLSFDENSPAWSPDGKTIAVSAASESCKGTCFEVFTIAADGRGELKQLTDHRFRSLPTLKWAADGSGLIAVADEQPQVDHQLWYISYPQGESRQINPNLNNYRNPLGVSSDGNILLTVQSEFLTNLWVAPADNIAQAKQITFSAIGGRNGYLGLEWMPDGRLVFPGFSNKSQPLWTINADGSGRKQLTPEGFIDLDPSVTADGRTVVFGSNRSGTFEVWSVNIDGGSLRQLTFDGGEMPGVSPDGKWIVYISTEKGFNELRRMPLGGGDPVGLTGNPVTWPRVSPDSSLIACYYRDKSDKGKLKLAVLPIDGGSPVKLFDLPSSGNLRYGLRWTADGSALTYRDWESGYWKQPLDGAAPQKLANLPQEKFFSAAWSPDGKQFAFVRGQESFDVVLIRTASSN